MTRVFKPHWDARMAVTYPPGPLPIIAKSYAGKGSLRPFVAIVLVPASLARRVRDQTGNEGRAAEPRGHAGRIPVSTDKGQILTMAVEARNLQGTAGLVGLVLLRGLRRRTVALAKKYRGWNPKTLQMNLSNETG